MTARNVLFIMCDQLRHDHLGCAGHPYLRTPNIDALARRGVRFSQAYVASGVCGPSRMSYYTGRYPSSHGATWNRVPLGVGEMTLGEYLRTAGRELSLAGKTHVMPDEDGIRRLGIAHGSDLATRLRAGYFEELDRHDGHHAEPHSAYADYLRAQGYDSADPWTDYVISAIDENGQVVSGWNMRNVHLPARVAEAHSETAYTTERAMEFIEARGDDPWVLHLSLVKPHWPYMAPAPYHQRYTLDQCLPLHRDPAELENAHPVAAAYRTQEECVNFMRAEVSDKVRPAYQGLIEQVDDHLGRLWELLERTGRWQDTLVVFTADHGDFLGDHWLGEKELFYDTVQKVPMIVYDPSAEADASRGTVDERFVSCVDVAPTILQALGLPAFDHRIEGQSLLAALRGQDAPHREFVVSELDYSFRKARLVLGRQPDECRAWMVRTQRWKYVHWMGLRPQLFDLARDPGELQDLGEDASLEGVRAEMREHLLTWFTRLKPRVTVDNALVAAKTDVYKKAGVFYGVW
ncbi:sulfatase-like hydrolase/transferase [Verticiella sediminum]|uniref:Sulfatase-like hydrolase/transferase n=1 Tax=Verticiella sediminum TaxID=1247510 RepID=A0A556A965_9BURK|nr:sulfatase-like hydrolase/transferase [Verticiella sediminum]TSH89415.1 sulfatase-like hydrolase/transferase [Verticiella sediminum]